MDAQGKLQRVLIQPTLIASSGEFLRDAAVNGEGICYLPTFIAYQQIKRGELIPLFNQHPSWTVNAYAIYPQTRHLSQRVRVFVDFLVKRFAGVPYWEQCRQGKIA